MQVLQLWDFFLSQPPTIIITLAASIIILRVDAIKGCLNDQVSLLSAPPAVDLLRCKVPPLSLATASPMCVTLSAKEYAASLTTSIPQCTFCMAGKDFRLWFESRFRFSLCAGFNPRDTAAVVAFVMFLGACSSLVYAGESAWGGGESGVVVVGVQGQSRAPHRHTPRSHTHTTQHKHTTTTQTQSSRRTRSTRRARSSTMRASP